MQKYHPYKYFSHFFPKKEFFYYLCHLKIAYLKKKYYLCRLLPKAQPKYNEQSHLKTLFLRKCGRTGG